MRHFLGNRLKWTGLTWEIFYDQSTRTTTPLYCFLMILGYSRKLYIEFFTKCDLLHFLIGHNNAFNSFGGYSREILYDNLKSVVIKRAVKAGDSEFNRKFMDFAGYYGFKPILCRPYKPNTKGKVENSVHFVKDNFYNGRTFHSLDELNTWAFEWLTMINERVHGTTKEVVNERFKRENLTVLRNKDLYDLSQIFYRRVHKDCHFSFCSNFYSVPYEYAGKEISVKQNDRSSICVFYREDKIAEHKLERVKKGQHITKQEHIQALKDIRMSHQLKRPIKKPKQPRKEKSLGLITHNTYSTSKVISRPLSYYEEVS